MQENESLILDSFDALPTESRSLFDRDLTSDIFSSRAWFQNLTETVFTQRDDVRLYVFRSDNPPHEIDAILPMRQCVSVGRLSSNALLPLANFYTPSFGMISASDCPAFDKCLAQWTESLSRQIPLYDQVSLFPLCDDSVFNKVAGRALETAGYVVQRYFCFGNWYLNVAGRNYDDYFKDLPSTLRHTVTRKSRQLASMPGLRLTILFSPQQATEGARAFDHVIRSSWKTPEPFPRFIPGLIKTCAEQGWLRMGVAYLHDKPIAFQIWFVYRNTASIYKLAYDEAHAKLSVGTVLTAMLMRKVIDEDGVTEVDYLNGDEQYKQDWMSGRRERVGIIAFNKKTIRGAMGAAWNLLGRTIRQLQKKSR